MKLFAPSYYQNFKCIADRCRHSCCIGWEIDVDDGAYARYAKADAPYAAKILRSIAEDGDGIRHFRLTQDERCPHLDETGLCRIICEMGEGYLCEICHEHPRFYHDTAHGKEVGIGMACEEGCRLILEAEDYRTFSPIGECEGEPSIGDLDTVAERDRLYAILSEPSLPYSERLCAIYTAYGVTPAIHTDEEWREMLRSLEYLHPSHTDLLSCFSFTAMIPKVAEAPLERALAYFIFRHASGAKTPDDFRTSLGFALFCERLLASMIASSNVADFTQICALARILSEELEYSEENTLAITEEFFFSLETRKIIHKEFL